MYLSRIEVSNFRKIKEMDLEIPENNRVLCFVGGNGSSKTSLVSVIVDSLVTKSGLRFSDYDPRKNVRYRSSGSLEIGPNSPWYTLEFDIRSYDKNEEQTNQTYKRISSLEPIKTEEIPQGFERTIREGQVHGEEFSTVGNKTYLKKHVLLDRPSTRHEREWLDIKNNDEKADISLKPTRVDGVRNQDIKVEINGLNTEKTFLDLYFDLLIGYRDIQATIDDLLDGFSRIMGTELGKVTIAQAPYRHITFEKFGLLESLSQGEKDILSTIAAIVRHQQEIKDYYPEIELLKVPGIVVIDEIDLHLHPRAQERVVHELSKIFPNIQFIITTHSPFIIRGLGDDALVVRLPDGDVLDYTYRYMDIDEITNSIFDYNGHFSETAKLKLREFKAELVREKPNYDHLSGLYKSLSKSESATRELNFLMATYSKGPSDILRIKGIEVSQ